MIFNINKRRIILPAAASTPAEQAPANNAEATVLDKPATPATNNAGPVAKRRFVIPPPRRLTVPAANYTKATVLVPPSAPKTPPPPPTPQPSAPAVPATAQPPPATESTAPTDSSPTALYRALLDGLYETVLIARLDGMITDVNKRTEQVLLFPRGAIVGKPIPDIIIGLSPKIMENILRQTEAGRFAVLDAYCNRNGRSSIPAEIAISRVILDRQESFCFAIRNMSARQQVQEMLEGLVGA